MHSSRECRLGYAVCYTCSIMRNANVVQGFASCDSPVPDFVPRAVEPSATWWLPGPAARPAEATLPLDPLSGLWRTHRRQCASERCSTNQEQHGKRSGCERGQGSCTVVWFGLGWVLLTWSSRRRSSGAGAATGQKADKTSQRRIPNW